MTATTPLPPDRGHVRTEHRHPRSGRLDALDVQEVVNLMIEDHRDVPDALARATGALSAFIEQLAARMRAGGRLIYIGAGTSGRLGVLDASECPPTFQSDPQQVIGIIAGGDAALRRSSEGREDDPNGAAEAMAALALTAHDAVLGIAAGGTTPYVLGALSVAKRTGAMTGLLTCAANTPRPPDCDHLIVLDTGPEILTGSTRLKAGSATKLALNIISTTVFIQLGKVYGNLMVDLRATNAKLTDRAIRILQQLFQGLDRGGAQKLLESAGGQVKLAILMHERNLSRAEAEQMLEAACGMLPIALGIARSS